ncbi:hypothetical protein ASD11_11400 [Aeromicrobium sp. Root495]|uniref:CHAP domain-containing protein n=1 Tax=Aeromicrobium sp. Root495 TaxID=1736550 RepID=UPI0007003FFC|nr:CHAP domain-containing protein [Aeromicrobium sp. Root495]KQY60093.1 hypothetical protein ASD11_11400 [Aeromicrobium sp. Root495]
MSWKSLGLASVVFAALLVPFSSADGSTLVCTSYSSCRGAGYSDYGYQKNQGTMYWRMYTGTNCTNYVAYRLVTTNGMPNTRPKSGVGNARDWGKAMSSITDSTPVVGSVAWWGRTGNHVAYVEKVVSSSEIIVSESNYGRAFDWRRVTKGSGWPDGFIHFADPTLANTAKPALSGSKRVGATLTTSSGTWKPAAAGTSYQWLLDGAAIKGATSSSYKPLATQVGHQLSARITAVRGSYSKATATSSHVTVARGVFVASQKPQVVGTAKVDVPLTVSSGTFSPAPSTRTYQWLADGVPVAGATSSTFTPGPELVDRTITATVGVQRTGYVSSSVTTGATAEVAAGAMSSTTAPTVNGTLRVDGTVRAAGGAWSQTGVTTAWQWLRDGKAIPGATESTYSPALADRGTTLAVSASASKPGYASATRTVTAGTVGDGIFTSTPRPRLSTTPRVSAPVSAEPGSWAPDAALSYQWLRDGKVVKGATRSTYTPVVADRGHRLSVTVTGRRAGYTSASSTSASAPVGEGVVSFRRQPSVVGTPRLGSRLVADFSVASPSSFRVHYQWLRDGVAITGATAHSYVQSSDDLGHRLDVRVRVAAGGHTTAGGTGTGSGPTLSTPALQATVTGGQGQADVVVSVKAPGVSPVTGRVRVTIGEQATTIVLKNGRGRAVVTGLEASSKAQQVGVRYGGSATVAAARTTRTTVVR